jgi:hypothetical protein
MTSQLNIDSELPQRTAYSAHFLFALEALSKVPSFLLIITSYLGYRQRFGLPLVNLAPSLPIHIVDRHRTFPQLKNELDRICRQRRRSAHRAFPECVQRTG